MIFRPANFIPPLLTWDLLKLTTPTRFCNQPNVTPPYHETRHSGTTPPSGYAFPAALWKTQRPTDFPIFLLPSARLPVSDSFPCLPSPDPPREFRPDHSHPPSPRGFGRHCTRSYSHPRRTYALVSFTAPPLYFPFDGTP